MSGIQTGIPSGKSKYFWGPKLWRSFHLLAEISDRNDISLIWKNWINLTAEVMPCEKCRTHLKEYLRTHRIIRVYNPLKITPAQVRDHMRKELFDLHNTVNRNTGKPIFSQKDYDALYKNKKRDAILSEVHSLIQEVEHEWLKLDHIRLNKGDYTNWKSTYTLLVTFLVSSL